MATNHLLATC